MASTFTPGKKHIVPLADLVPLYEEQFEKLFENFKFGYKKLKDENVEITASEIMSWLQHMTLRSDVDVPPPPKHQVCKDDVKKIEEWTHRTWRTQYIMGRIKTEVLFMLMIYYSIIDNTSTSDTMKEVNDQMNVLRDLYIKLGEPFEEHPTEYFRIRKELSVMTQKLISILAFVHWMETGTPLLKSTAVEKMGLWPPVFDLDFEDYLFGLCFMLEDLTRYATTLYFGGDHDSLSNMVMFMKTVEKPFGILDLPNGKLRQKFDGLKHNIKRVEDMMLDAGL
ncbi:translin-1-like [Henckelia pumila]|uniref:translin-1-like n=1 Tax=Henckelia pumila TaxID=405737 RepID=UPI003C6E17DD